MTGPQHFQEAERLLATLANVEAGSVAEPGVIAEAQVHATLALAAATALANGHPDGMTSSENKSWRRVAGGTGATS